MHSKLLVTMANDIATFFATSSDEGPAGAENFAAHLRRYWGAGMRKQIIDYVKQDGEGLMPLARAGVALLVSSAEHTKALRHSASAGEAGH